MLVICAQMQHGKHTIGYYAAVHLHFARTSLLSLASRSLQMVCCLILYASEHLLQSFESVEVIIVYFVA